MENIRIERKLVGGSMKLKQWPIIQTQPMPMQGWSLRWTPWIASGFACVGYLSGILSTRPLTLVSALLLTGIYGTWLVIYQIVQRRFVVGWLLALFCLAVASQFIPLPGTNVYWLPLLPVITSNLMMAIRPRPLGWGLSCALCLSSYLAVRRITPDWDSSGQVLLLLAFLITYGYVVIIRELALAHTAKDVANARLAEAHTRLQEYSAQVEELSTVRERNRIAREIHDTLGHTLTLLSVQLETATQLEARGDSRLHEKLLEARRVAKACLADVRHSVEALRPDEASSGSLPEQLQRLAKEFETTCHETSITLDIEEATHPLNSEQCQALYRCAQEALTNIRKYAHATKVLLRLSTSGGRDGMVELTVLDNGQGGLPQHEQNTSGFGLVGMRERVTLLDGTLRAGPELGHGWRVEVVLPFKQQGQADATAMRMGITREKISSWQNRSA
jgi:signal transduction histidine kinase